MVDLPLKSADRSAKSAHGGWSRVVATIENPDLMSVVIFLPDRFFGNAQFDPSYPGLQCNLVRVAVSGERMCAFWGLHASVWSMMFCPGWERASRTPEANFVP